MTEILKEVSLNTITLTVKTLVICLKTVFIPNIVLYLSYKDIHLSRYVGTNVKIIIASVFTSPDHRAAH